MTASSRAWDLRAKLFALVGEFKDFAAAVSARDRGDDPEAAAATQADAAACELARVHSLMSGPRSGTCSPTRPGTRRINSTPSRSAPLPTCPPTSARA
jgi:hypothetical protein